MANQFIRVRCPDCRAGLKIPANKTDKRICCPDCESIFFAGENISESASASREISESRLEPNSGPAKPETVVDTGSVVSFESGRQGAVPRPDQIHQRETYWNPKRRIRTPSAKKNRRTVAAAHPGLIKKQRKQVIKTKSLKREYESATHRNTEMMTATDDAMNTIGVVFVLCAIASGMLPAMALQFKALGGLANFAPAISMIFGLVGFSLICFAHRRKGLAVITIGYVMAGVVMCVGWFGYWLQTAGENKQFSLNGTSSAATAPNDIGNSSGGSGIVSTTEREDSVKRRVEDINSRNPNSENSQGSVSDAPDSNSPAATNTPPASTGNSVANIPSNSNLEPNANPHSEQGSFTQSREEDEYIDDPDDPFLIRKKPKNESSKTEGRTRAVRDIEFRTADSIVARWNEAHKSEPDDFEANFRRSAFAGNTTNGRFMYGHKAMEGVDFFRQLQVGYLTPVYADEPFTSESIVADSGYRFAGLNLAFESGAVVAVQGIFAPAKGNGLNTSKLSVGKWHGNKTGWSDTKRIITPGPFVYGLIVNRRENKVIGVGLINKK